MGAIGASEVPLGTWGLRRKPCIVVVDISTL